MGEFSDYGDVYGTPSAFDPTLGIDPNASYDMPYDDATDPAALDDTLPGEDEIPFDPQDTGTSGGALQRYQKMASPYLNVGGDKGLQLGTWPDVSGGKLPAARVAAAGRKT